MHATATKPSRPVKQLHLSASALPEAARMAVIAGLNSSVCDVIDLMTHIKLAHWNIKGPLFSAVHPLLDTFAAAAVDHGDALAERATALGGHIYATARHVAEHTRLTEYPQDTSRGIDHVRHLSERMQECLQGLRNTRQVAEAQQDDDSVDLVTGIVVDLEQKTWFLLAHLAE